ncbi:MAG TPA: hypothetical protein VGE11_13355 [Pseudonocardia sp.]
MDHRLRISVRLNTAAELFTVAEFDPFAERSRAVSGVDEITADLRSRRLRGRAPLQVELALPVAEISPQTAVEVRKAMERYCAEQIGQARKRKKVISFEGRSKLASELIIIPLLAVVLAVVLAVAAIPEVVIDVVTPLITVTIWVAIWNPVDSLLFDRWSAKRDIEVHEYLASADVDVRGY